MNLAELPDVLRMWIGFSHYHCSLTALVGKKAVGIGTLFLMPYRKVAHHSMFYMIVDPQERGKGIGSHLLRNLAHLSRHYFGLEQIHIEIYEGCKLTSLLVKQDFRLLARQERFVEWGGEYKARLVYAKFF